MTEQTAEAMQTDMVRRLYFNRPLAHRFLFRHRHPQASPAFHEDMIVVWHGDNKLDQFLVFRGGAKSTISEEAIIIKALFREFKNCLIIGFSEDKAIERLRAIKHELATNEKIIQIFGDQRGQIWGDTEIVLASGIKIQALGRGQSLRGTKHLDMRPDLCLVDDVEERSDVRTPELRKKVLLWLFTELIPALAPGYQLRLNATPLDPDAIPMRLETDEAWTTHKYPIYYTDEFGERASAWVERFPLSAPPGLSKKQLKDLGVEPIDKLEASFTRQGLSREFRCEYLVQAEAPEDKTFKEEMFVVAPRVRTWQAVYGFFDPARTTKVQSSNTGFVAWSWVGPKLVVWDAWGKTLSPSEIIGEVFAFNDAYSPVWVGVELDGLEEFLMQPIRQEQARRGVMLPVRGERAPKGKNDFIRGLQPFFNAREVEFAQPLPDLKRQLLAFPTGKIDVPNALAYALKLRPGAPIYDSFGFRNVTEGLQPVRSEPMWLAMNATRAHTTAILCQVQQGCLRVYKDWVREGGAAETAVDLLRTANMEAGRALRVVGGPIHFDQYNNVGLRQALARMPAELRRGTPPALGRPYIESLLQREFRGFPMVQIDPEARWTLNGFSAGYARSLEKNGVLSDNAEEGVYRTLLEGLESFAGLLTLGSPDEDNAGDNFAYTAGGRRYKTAMPQREQ